MPTWSCLSTQTMGGATLTVTANASGNTISFYASSDPPASAPTNWFALNATPSNSSTATTSTTSTGSWQANVAGYTYVCMEMSTLVSGTSTVRIQPSTASARSGGGGSGTSSNQTKYGASYNSSGTATAVDASAAAPSTNGTYNLEEIVTAGAAVAPAFTLVGLVPDQAAGATVLFSDNNNVILNPAAALALPTPTTLGNANFFSIIATPGGTASTITPATWTISLNGGTAGATAVAASKSWCSLLIDQVASTQWDLNCSPIGTSGATFPVTVSGTVNSGGIPCFNSATNEETSAAIAAGVLIKGGGAGACAAASSITDNGTTATTADTGGYVAPVFVSNGTTAGFVDLPQGTTSAAVAPCSTATSICEQAPTAVTSYLLTRPAAAPDIASYRQTDGCAAASCTESYHPVPVVLTVTSDFTDSTSTTLVLVTGLSTTMPVSKAVVVKYDCLLYFDQSSTAVVDEIGVGITGTAPTYSNHHAVVWANASHAWTTTGVLSDLASTTPTLVASFTPSAITTIWSAELSGTIEQPSNATPGVFGVYVYTTTGTDNFIVKRDSACSVIYQ